MSSTITPSTSADPNAAKDLRYNFLAGVIDSVGWPLGMAFFSTSTILEAFLLRLHASNVLIGALPAVVALGYFMPGAVVAGRIKRLKLVRPWVFWVGIVERIPILLIPLLVMRLGTAHGGLLLASFFVLFGIHAIALGCNQPSYWVVIGKLIPAQIRGRMFGIAGLLGGIAGFAVDPVAHYFLSHAGATSLSGYAWCFLVGGLLVFVSFLPIGLMREKPLEPLGADPHVGHYLRDAMTVVRADASFRLFMFSSVPFAFCGAAATYYLAACTLRFHPGPSEVALYTTVVVVAGAFGNILWGLWADRSGNKIVLAVATGFGILGAVLSVFVDSPTGYAWAFCLSALGMAGVTLTSNNIVLEFAPNESDIPLYMAVYNGFSGPFKALAPLLYGWIADRAGFNPVFVSGAILGLASLAIIAPVREPRPKAESATVVG